MEIPEGQLTQVVCLNNISWQTYIAMLNDMDSSRATRVAYSQGAMTIKMPSKLHEIVNRLLAFIVRTLAVELDLPCVDVGSMTLQRDDLEKGAEPDTGFYIQNAEPLRGLEPNIPVDLPPDLVIEVDITNPSTRRMVIYKALGVPEVWQYTKRNNVTIYHLLEDGYVEAVVSKAFSPLTSAQLNRFVAERQAQDDRQLTRSIRTWVQSSTNQSSD